MRSENFALVAVAAQKFGCRPSRLIGLGDPVLALDFDLAAAARLLEMERSLTPDAGPDPAGPAPPAGAARGVDW